MVKTAVVTGVTGQFGYYLTNYLLHKQYQVVGVDRRTSMPTYERLFPLMGKPGFHMVSGDITDISSIQTIIRNWQPDEFYNLAAQSFVGDSWEQPVLTSEVTGIGVLNCLEAVRKIRPKCKFYQSSSSEMFGNSFKNLKILSENSPMIPDSPYAAAKLFGHSMVGVYRRSHNMYAATGIMFNSESPLRGEEFVTRVITKQLALVKHGLASKVKLGNTGACRDWSFAGDAARAIHAIMQLDSPDDYVISTGSTHSVDAFLCTACEWFGFKRDDILEIDQTRFRPKDVDVLLGSSEKLRNETQWEPKTSFQELVHLMCEHDYYYYSPDPAMKAKANNYLYPKDWSMS